ncbi:YrdB family protein [Spirillospora sp. NPDC127200]
MRLPGPLHLANEGLAFLLEVLALILLAWWGFTTGDALALHVLLGIGTPVAAAVLWGMFAAPRARFRAGLPVVLLVKAVVFGSAAAALYAVGHPAWAIAFAIVAAANTALATADRQAHFHARREAA